MPTFGELRKVVLREANAKDHFKFCELGQKYRDFWEKINHVEYKRGYSEDYHQKGSPALCEMELLTEEEFRSWIREFEEVQGK